MNETEIFSPFVELSLEQLNAASRQLISRENDLNFKQNILNKAPALIYLQDKNTGGVRWCNESMETAFGLSSEKIIRKGKKFFEEVIHPDDYPHSGQYNKKFQINEETFGCIVRAKGYREKTWRWFVGISRIYHGNKRPEMLCLFLDFTTATHTEQQMKEALNYTFLRHHQHALDKITPREKEVLTYLTKGYSTLAIANELHLSHHTVASHRKNIRVKFNVKNTPEMIAYAKKLGM